MARSRVDDVRTQAAILEKRLAPKADPFTENHHASFDDLVLLPANLSRLVIDPYRDACNTVTDIMGAIEIGLPVVAGGLEGLPNDVRHALGTALSSAGSAYVGRSALVGSDAPWIQLVLEGKDTPDASARAHAFIPDGAFKPFKVVKQSGKLTGIVLHGRDVAEGLPFALENALDFVILDGTSGISDLWPELNGQPNFSVINEAVHLIRQLNREEDLDLIYFGGVRSGTDLAKLIGLGMKAGIVGTSMALALGGEIREGRMNFHGDRTDAERVDGALSLVNAMSAEISIMARCTGKTDVRNIEPEDLRSISIASSRAFGIALAGMRRGEIV